MRGGVPREGAVGVAGGGHGTEPCRRAPGGSPLGGGLESSRGRCDLSHVVELP